jgi:hypothetical protein
MAATRGGFVGVFVVVSLACGEDPSGRNDGVSVGSIGSVGSITTTAATGDTSDPSDTDAPDDDGDGSTGGGGVFDLGDGAAESQTPDECAALVEQADVGLAGADIIIVIDNSQSMTNEIAEVQAQMNAFSQQIIAANVDPHVVMVSGFEHNSDSGICVPPPLGSGLCPQADHNPPTYWRVGDWVGSHSSLSRVVTRYPQYMPTIRDDAPTHVLVVSDDDSDWTAEQFTMEFTALNPKFSDFVLHAIVTGGGGTYHTLVQQTGGILGDLSQGEFQPIFDELASQVIAEATLACSFAIPPPPNGQVFNPAEVNVEFDDGGGGVLAIGNVANEAACAGVTGGWYYDDPLAPTTIHLCPQTCDEVQGFALATVSILFGCATIPAG